MNIFFHLLIIGYGLSWIYMLRKGILILIPAIKCRNREKCQKDDCPFRKHCRHTTLSDAERAFIQKKIDSLKD